MTVDKRDRKRQLRNLLKKARSEVSSERRFSAAGEALAHLRETLVQHTVVVSYSSFGDEFCTKQINELLAQHNRLALPRVFGQEMKTYLVTDIQAQLIENEWGIMEPNPEECEEISLSNISLILVPALGFDKNNHRIGYGGGFYDRFLARQRRKVSFIGIGYKEQYTAELVPTEPTDVALTEVFLY